MIAVLTAVVMLSAAFYGRLSSYAGDRLAVRGIPGEFEEQQAIWVMWPSEVYDCGDMPVKPVILDIVQALLPHVKVNIMVANDSEAAEVKQSLARQSCPDEGVNYYVINHQSIWGRDVGPVFVKDQKNRLCVVDFRFNNYGRYGDHYYVSTECQVDVQVANALKLPVIESRLVSEGGSFETNGQGILLLTEAVALQHNRGMTRAQIEDEYKRVLGIKKIIWLKQGLAEDKVTGGHVDEFVRFTSGNTILLAEVLPPDRHSSPLANSSAINLEQNYKILLNATDQDGQPFRIIRIPMPPTMYGNAGEEDEIPVRSYLNFVVANGAVLMTTYWKPGRPYALKTAEDEVLKTFRAVFPGREIIEINAEPINAWGGGLHCVTQHMPAVTAD